jgi:hypothetical protein
MAKFEQKVTKIDNAKGPVSIPKWHGKFLHNIINIKNVQCGNQHDKL